MQALKEELLAQTCAARQDAVPLAPPVDLGFGLGAVAVSVHFGPLDAVGTLFVIFFVRGRQGRQITVQRGVAAHVVIVVVQLERAYNRAPQGREEIRWV